MANKFLGLLGLDVLVEEIRKLKTSVNNKLDTSKGIQFIDYIGVAKLNLLQNIQIAQSQFVYALNSSVARSYRDKYIFQIPIKQDYTFDGGNSMPGRFVYIICHGSTIQLLHVEDSDLIKNPANFEIVYNTNGDPYALGMDGNPILRAISTEEITAEEVAAKFA